jgi:hypothetical protein
VDHSHRPRGSRWANLPMLLDGPMSAEIISMSNTLDGPRTAEIFFGLEHWMGPFMSG